LQADLDNVAARARAMGVSEQEIREILRRPIMAAPGFNVTQSRILDLQRAGANSIRQRIQEITDRVVQQFDNEPDHVRFSPPQRDAMLRKPWLRDVYRGGVIHERVFEEARRDPVLNRFLGRINDGPDFRSLEDVWWIDVTTRGEWGKHVRKYGPRGYGVFYE
jgi:hypothetical protein